MKCCAALLPRPSRYLLNPVAARRASHFILPPPCVNTQSANMLTETRNLLLRNIDKMKVCVLAWTGLSMDYSSAGREVSNDSYNQRTR